MPGSKSKSHFHKRKGDEIIISDRNPGTTYTGSHAQSENDKPSGHYHRGQRRKGRVRWNTTTDEVWRRTDPRTNEWKGPYSFGGTTCPAPMTRAALIALRNASGLSKDCDYVITDHVQGRLVAGTTIHLQAVSANKLSENVQVNTTYDNEAWRGVYDIDRGLVLELQDNRNNIARGINGTQVTNFDWGNTSYTNVVVDNATLTANVGNTAPKTNLIVEKGASLNLTGFTGNMNNITFSTAIIANFTNANGTWRLSTMKGGGAFNASGYTGGGDNYYIEIDGACNINISNSSSNFRLRQSTINASTITHTGVSTGTFNLTLGTVFASTITHGAGAGNFTCTSNSRFVSGSNISHNRGAITLTNCYFRTGTISQTTNAGAITNLSGVKVESNSSVINQSAGTINATNSIIEINSNIQRQAAATGALTFNYSKITGGSSVNLTTTNRNTANITYSEIHGSSNVTHASNVVFNATRLYMKSVSNIRFTNGSAGAVTLNDTEMLTGSINKQAGSTAGNLRISGGSKLYSSGFINMNGTGNLTFVQCDISGSSGVSKTAGNRNYTFNRLIMTTVSRMTLSGTGNLTDTHNELEMHFRSNYTNSCSGAANSILYAEISGLSGALSLTGTTGASSFNRLKLRDGSVTKANNPNRGTYQLWNISDAGIVNLINHPANTTINYIDISNGSRMNVNKTGAGVITNVQILNGGNVNLLTNSSGISKLLVEQGTVNHGGGTLTNVSKKMTSTFTVNGGTQNNVHHWSTLSKTTTTNNTGRADYVGIVSTLPIL